MKSLWLCAVVALATLLSGCAAITEMVGYEPKPYMPPGYLEAKISNPSDFYIRIEVPNEISFKNSLITAQDALLEPRKSIIAKAECAGTFKGIAHIYKKACPRWGGGCSVPMYLGRQEFSITVDNIAMRQGKIWIDNEVTLTASYDPKYRPHQAKPLFTLPRCAAPEDALY